ncbi:hypothetical protein [Nostoc favosum]|uniref:Uncharacterized protein n=1 Tax=Nostoc favosum CHAB5714 TaxID=2780399 RepID=A0ABS8IAM8_9NOSO|nr:hypothetical protein [Nostoc favosum]MCC5600547.1 hypothetical protein [Nostoc favosum CHAB5714]
MLVKDDYSKFIYSIDVNNSVEYFCEIGSSCLGRYWSKGSTIRVIAQSSVARRQQ